ncbi:MAG: adenylate/guanylate cyclase domain-containing protein [Desulfotignum sp.]|nr:adenylate/guanylate cyclase domain-containing protein [Desulfotignum sp.]MCF8088555.1 adenylate/guanylate cyclase domain-containing protein [Desulfotignum sp.]MCF8137945.1 adenylate/guanylate cyclase domain-containing protein [Desulfotignum sp.]
MRKIFSKLVTMFKKKGWVTLVTGAVITLLVAGLYVFKPAYLGILEYKLYDAVFQKVHSKESSDAVAIVDIDEYSLERFGQWPWPRYRVALLLQKIHMAGAIAVGVDILFAEPDGTSPVVLKKAFKNDLGLDVAFSGVPEGLMDNDHVLAAILQQGASVLGYSFGFEKSNPHKKIYLPPSLNAVEIKAPGADPVSRYLFQSHTLIPPLPDLLKGGTPAGFMNTITDKDGVLRRVPLCISFDQNIYPQLALATLLTAFKDNISDPMIKTTRGGVESIKIGNTVIPLESNGAMLLNYRGPSHSFPYISAGKILEDELSAGQLAGKIVFLGTSAAGLKDIRVSPLDPVFPGVEVHATIVDNILTNDVIHRPDWIPGLEIACILFWGLATTFLIGWGGAHLTLPLTMLLGVSVWYGSVWALGQMNIWISHFFPMLVLVLNFSILNMQKFWISEKRKKFFRSAFSKYVSKSVVDQLAENPEKLSLDGEEKQISILFSDIRGFTTLSERLSPSQVTMLLHDYFTPVTQIIMDNQGTHDKFLGDAVMCFWNAPLDVRNHENTAIKAALEIIELLPEINKKFEERFGVSLEIGIGLHSGLCRVGNMGSDDIFDYTIIGDNVNLASRLEGLTKFYGVQLIVSETMLRNRKKDLLIKELDMVRVKGKNDPVRIFTVYSSSNENRDHLEKEIQEYAEGLNLYRKRNFGDAENYFSSLAARHPDQKLYPVYQERCVHFIDNPPDENWDGVFVHTSK